MSPESSSYEPKIGESKRNSQISEWLKPEPTEIKEKESDNSKYYIIVAMLMLSCLAWYYFDDIKPVGASLIERIRSFRPRPGNDPRNDSNNIPANTTENLKKRLKNLFNKDNPDLYSHDNSSQATITPIILEDKTPIATSSKVKLEKFQYPEHPLPDYSNLYPPIEPQLTGLPDLIENKKNNE